MVRLSGVIGAVTPLRPGMSLAGVAKTLNAHSAPECQSGGARDQFARRLAGAIAPDLSADQAARGGKEIAGAGVRRGCRGVRRLHDSLRGRRDFCDPSSILGSIGVVGGSFGFQELIKKIGVERRLYTAGAHKATLDPFLPENPDDVARLKELQREIHAIFIALVKQSRGAASRAPTICCSPANIGPARPRCRWALRMDRRSPFDAARPLWRKGADAGDRARRAGCCPGCWDAIGRRGGLHGVAGRSRGLPDELISALETRAIWAKFGF